MRAAQLDAGLFWLFLLRLKGEERSGWTASTCTCSFSQTMFKGPAQLEEEWINWRSVKTSRFWQAVCQGLGAAGLCFRQFIISLCPSLCVSFIFCEKDGERDDQGWLATGTASFVARYHIQVSRCHPIRCIGRLLGLEGGVML